MKKSFIILAFVLCSCLNVLSQATSMTVDCQTPGWLSSMINYGDQQTLKNIKLTGYINGKDLQFILNLNKKQSLTGVIDLENVKVVSGGIVIEDNILPTYVFKGGRNIQKLVLPNTLLKATLGVSVDTDSIIWTNNSVTSLNVSTNISYDSKYYYLPEGVEKIRQIPKDVSIVFPSTIKTIECGESDDNLIIYSFINNPQEVYAQYERYYADAYGGHRSYWATISNSTFYIPKGTKEKYLESDFAKMKALKIENGMDRALPNGNIFIEYYDIDRVEIESPIKVYKGDTCSLNVTIYPDANLVSWIDYVSDDTEIISANVDGTIVANDYGQTEVFATPHVFIDGLETKTGSCIVKVLAHVEGVDMPTTFSLHIDEQKTIEAKTLPLDITDNQLTFESSDPTIADVNEEGVITGHKRGTCTIIATSVDGGYKAECLITVKQPVEALSLEKHSLELKVGENEKLYAQITPANADDRTITWSSSDEKVATVDGNGNITAIEGGEVWIQAVSNDNAEAKDVCKLVVKQPVTGITLSKNSCSMSNVGESLQLEAKVLPENASNKEVRWSSSNESVCVVSNGMVVATGFGTAVVMATTVDGGFLASCTVTVEDTTGIRDINDSRQDDASAYDAMGRKVQTTMKGHLYIRNGKKFIAK